MLTKTCIHHGFLDQENIILRGKKLSCRLCERERVQKHRDANREKINLQQKKIYRENREKERERSKLKYRKFRLERMEYHIFKTYGLKADQYWKMVQEQNNKCKLCGKEETRKSCGDYEFCRLTIDHCHDTGKVRGLLCHACNVGIGSLKHDISLMQKCIEYLKVPN